MDTSGIFPLVEMQDMLDNASGELACVFRSEGVMQGHHEMVVGRHVRLDPKNHLSNVALAGAGSWLYWQLMYPCNYLP